MYILYYNFVNIFFVTSLSVSLHNLLDFYYIYIYIEILRRAWPLIYVTKGKRFNKILLCCLKENTIGQYNTNVNST